MSKIITFILIVFSLISIKSIDQKGCISELFTITDNNLVDKYEKIESKNEFGIRHTIDSINFSIIRRWKGDMTPIIESITNKVTNIDSWKKYHDNGQLKAIGYMTASVHTYIGEWKYYSYSGQLDSIIDFDSKYKVGFCEFYQIANDKGLNGRTSTINFDIEHRKWRIEKWNYGKNSSSAVGIELKVDSMKIEEIELIGKY